MVVRGNERKIKIGGSMKSLRGFVLITVLVVVFSFCGCSSSGSSTSSGDATENPTENEVCEKPDSYGKQSIDAFLDGSYKLCVTLTTANDFLRKTNVMLYHPRGPIGWAEDELKKEANKETNKVLNPLERLSSMVSEYIPAITKLNSDLASEVTQVPTILSSAPGALTDAQSLGFMKMSGAISNINKAKTNLTKAGEELPKLIAGLKQAFAGLSVLMSKIQKGEPLNTPMLAGTATGSDASSADAGNATRDNVVATSPIAAGGTEGLEAQKRKEVDDLTAENNSLREKINVAEKKNRELMAKLSELETATKALQDQQIRTKIIPNQEQPTLAKRIPEQATPSQIAQYENVVVFAKENDLQTCIERMQTLLDAGIGADYTGNCYYWIGLCRYSMHNYSSAIEQFKEVLRLPVSQKKDAAHLMLGKSYRKSGNLTAAKAEFQTLVEEYPQSQYVREAGAYLKKN